MVISLFGGVMARDERSRTGRLGWGATLPCGTGWGPDASVCMAIYSTTGPNSLFDFWDELNDSVEAVTWGRILRSFEDTTGIEGSWTTSEALTAVGTGGAKVWLGRGPFSGSSIWWRHSRPSFSWMQYDAEACCVTIVPVCHFLLFWRRGCWNIVS